MKCQDCDNFHWDDSGIVWCHEQEHGGACGDSEFLYKNCPLPKVEELNNVSIKPDSSDMNINQG